VYNKLVQKAFSGHFAGSFFHSFIHSFSFEPSLMNKPSLPVQQACSPPSLPTKRRISSIACLPAYCSCACQLCFKVGTLIIQVLGLGSKPQFWFGSGLHVLGINWWPCVCVILLSLVSCLVLAFFFGGISGGHQHLF
jgi:hypothetical protein